MGLALRADMANLRTELQGEMAQLGSDLRGEMAQFKVEMLGEMAQFRADIDAKFNRLLFQLLGSMAGFVTLVLFLSRMH